MARDTKLLQTILDKVSSVDRKVDTGFAEVKQEIKKTNERIDKIGLQLARLEDDSPTIEEFDDLERRVTKIQRHLALE